VNDGSAEDEGTTRRIPCALLLGLGLFLQCCDDTSGFTAAGRFQESASLPADVSKGAAGVRRNVVLILIDTLRPDHLDLHGYPKETAPFLNALGRDSVVFERAFSSSSWTAPSTASVFTGLYPPRHGLIQGFRANLRSWKAGAERSAGEEKTLILTPLPEEISTLPQRFQAAGYRTYGAAANINIDERVGFARGFDRFELDTKADAEDLFRQVEEWGAEIESGDPYYLYLHFNDVHRPYEGREPWYEPGRQKLDDFVARYDSEIRYLDGHLEALYRKLGWDRNTVLMMVSDHGEEFGEHGRIGHQFTLHQEVNRVLMMVHSPALTLPGRRVQVNVSLVDVMPTLLELASLPVPAAGDGMSLVPLLRDGVAQESEASFSDRTLYAHRANFALEEKHLYGVIHGDYRLIENTATGECGLFNFRADPLETTDLSEEKPEIVEALRAKLSAFKGQGIRTAHKTVDILLDDKMMNLLEELGYVEQDEPTNDAHDKDKSNTQERK